MNQGTNIAESDIMHKICVIGLGYMGLPTALLLAKAGCQVVGYDIDQEKVELLNKGQIMFEEQGIKELFSQARPNFRAISILNERSLGGADAYILCVPTPVKANKAGDISFVTSAAKSIVPFIKKGDLVILESTVGPGTTKNIVRKILEESGLAAGSDFSLSYVSEKAIPGNTLHEMVNNTRIIGGIDKKSAEHAKEIYSNFVKGEFYLTDTVTAETGKLVENTFRDINIAYANELAKMCEHLEINVWEVIAIANKHPRVNVHSPGPGVGGHCIPVDPWFLLEQANSDFIKGAREINDSMPAYIFSRLKEIMASKGIKDPIICILGVSYKKNVDDWRETPAIELIELCIQNGWTVKIHDPLVTKFTFPLTRDIGEALHGTDIAVIISDHDYYRKIDFTKHAVFDTRNMNIKAKEHYLLGKGGSI
jgi:UDP-N-acetyl-D-mannosaminuronic acid dehydrogenase